MKYISTRKVSSILSIYRDPQGCDIVATLSVAMISQSLRVAISFNSATKILSFFVLFCDICQYRNKISDFFEHFLRYGKYRKKGQKGAKIFVALLCRIDTVDVSSKSKFLITGFNFRACTTSDDEIFDGWTLGHVFVTNNFSLDIIILDWNTDCFHVLNIALGKPQRNFWPYQVFIKWFERRIAMSSTFSNVDHISEF